MVNSNSQNQKIIFLENTSPIISELLKKYQLQETSGELSKKLTGGEIPRGGIILDIVIEVAQGKILKKDLSSALQKRLEISEEKTKKLAEDVEKKLLVLAKKVPKEETEIPEEPPVTKKPLIAEKPSIIEKPETPPKRRETSEEPDVYREVIE